MKQYSFLVVIVGLAAILGAALFWYEAPGRDQASAKIQVVASFYPLYFFAQEIAGARADIANITPAGAEPHEYEPTAQDAVKIENANLLIINGGGLEGWGDDAVRNADPEKTLVIVVGKGLTTQLPEENEPDPHIWLEPSRAKKITDAILSGFIRVDPAHEAEYAANAEALRTELGLLDQEYQKELANCQQDTIVTAHAAFGYLADAYGFKQLSIAGLSPHAEPSPREMFEIASFIEKNHVGYIFFESLASPDLAETLAHETGAKTLVLNPIEGLTREEISSGKDYFTEMRTNLENLKIALQCAN